MDTAFAATRLQVTEPAMSQPRTGIIKQLRTLFAQAVIALLAPTIHSYHNFDGCFLPFYSVHILEYLQVTKLYKKARINDEIKILMSNFTGNAVLILW